MRTKPLQIEIVAHVLGSMNHCSHCQVFIDGLGVGGAIKQTDLNSYPPDFMLEWQRLSDWVLELAERYEGQLTIKITDAQSPQGLWKAIRHGVRQYPTFLIRGKKYHGWDTAVVEEMIQTALQTAEGP
ncbi:MAG: hypothetical protein D6796_15770 [Caldilineae bacterium]|nr:MAG: hypothetical protein D6796_15770 [Caldilineae bacterium]